MQAIQHQEICKVKIDGYDCTIFLKTDHLRLLLVNDAKFCRYSADINHQFLKNNKNFEFFFTSIAELHHYLTTCYSQITVSENGYLRFSLEMAVGSKIKKYECEIATIKEQMPQNQASLIKTTKLQNQIDSLKDQIVKLKKAFDQQKEKQKIMSLKMIQYEKIINSKDEIINTIFHELKEIREWREELEKKQQSQIIQKTKFISDETNPHFKKFIQIGNKFKKISGGTWDVLINKIPLEKTETTKYHIHQIRAGNNGSFMYGIGTEFIKGLNRAQDSKEFIGYYENTGNVYEQGESKKGGPRIKDGEIVTIIIDPVRWKVYWHINGKKEAEANIAPQLRFKNLYLALVVFNDESQVQFFS